MAVAHDCPALRWGRVKGGTRAALWPLPPLGWPFCRLGLPGGPPLSQVGDTPWPAAYVRSRIRRNGKCDGTEPREASLSPDPTWEVCHLQLGLPSLHMGNGGGGCGERGPLTELLEANGTDLLKCHVSCLGVTSSQHLAPPAILARGGMIAWDPVQNAPRKPASGLPFSGERCALVDDPAPSQKARLEAYRAVGSCCWKGFTGRPGGATGRMCQYSGYIPVVALLLASLPLPPAPRFPLSLPPSNI